MIPHLNCNKKNYITESVEPPRPTAKNKTWKKRRRLRVIAERPMERSLIQFICFNQDRPFYGGNGKGNGSSVRRVDLKVSPSLNAQRMD